MKKLIITTMAMATLLGACNINPTVDVDRVQVPTGVLKDSTVVYSETDRYTASLTIDSVMYIVTPIQFRKARLVIVDHYKNKEFNYEFNASKLDSTFDSEGSIYLYETALNDPTVILSGNVKYTVVGLDHRRGSNYGIKGDLHLTVKGKRLLKFSSAMRW